jgi:hypothetical protein
MSTMRESGLRAAEAGEYGRLGFTGHGKDGRLGITGNEDADQGAPEGSGARPVLGKVEGRRMCRVLETDPRRGRLQDAALDRARQTLAINTEAVETADHVLRTLRAMGRGL